MISERTNVSSGLKADFDICGGSANKLSDPVRNSVDKRRCSEGIRVLRLGNLADSRRKSTWVTAKPSKDHSKYLSTRCSRKTTTFWGGAFAFAWQN
jgi:hypothetical protein